MRKHTPSLAVIVLAGLVPSSAFAVPYFNAPVNIGPEADWSNYIVMADVDGDGDLDVIVPNCGTFNGTTPQPLRLYINSGTGTFSAPINLVTKAVRQVALGDVDGDGDLDMYVPDAGSDAPDIFYRNDGGTFVDATATALPAGLSSSAGGARFGDVDGDGDLDLLVANGYQGADELALYLNDGTGVFTEHPASPLAVGTGDSFDIDLVDVDGDFDLDVLIDKHVAKHRLLLNDGTGTFTDASAGIPGLGPADKLHYNPSACDLDGDGDRDLLFDNTGPNGGEQVMINDGAGVYTDTTATSLPTNPGTDDNGFVCADIDDDGDFDGVIPALGGGPERVQFNDGLGVFAQDTTIFPNGADNTLWIDLGDLNGDGRLDAVTAQGEPAAPNKVYIGNANNPVDSQPPKIFAVQPVATPGANTPTPIRFAVSDRVATDVGPRLQGAYLKFTAPAAQAQVPAHFIGGDLFYATIPGFAGGTAVSFQPCATDQQGNEGCGAAVAFTIGGMGTGGAGGNGTGGNGTGGQGTGGDGGATGGGGNGGNGGPVLESGCGCTVPGADRGLGALGLVLPLAFALRRRRRS